MSKLSNESLFSIDDFRDYVRDWVRARGRGEFRKISEALGIHTTLVSQIFRGRKCLTEEQAAGLAGYMKLTHLESDYFLKLVQIERAGNEALRVMYKRQLLQIRSQANEVKARVPVTKALSELDRALFYSSWHYSFVRLLTSMTAFQTVESISRRSDLPISRTQEILNFLTSRGLCLESKGRYTRTEKNTHVEATSPLVIRHHQNWRAKSLDLHERMSSNDLAFTAPVSIAREDIPKVRAVLLNTISEISKIVESSGAEEVAYLGIDWIKI
jgi:uncharacterized protein (TIGR02147 family)